MFRRFDASMLVVVVVVVVGGVARVLVCRLVLCWARRRAGGPSRCNGDTGWLGSLPSKQAPDYQQGELLLAIRPTKSGDFVA